MKKDTYYFSHDYNARNDRKLIKVKLKYKQSGLGIYWSIVEMLYEENGRIKLSEVPTISMDLKEPEAKVLSVIKDFELFKNDDDFFWSESVKRRLDKRLEKSEKAKESIRIRWQNTNVIRTNNDSNTIKERKGKEIKEKKIGGGKPPTFKTWDEKEFYNEVGKFKDQYTKETLRGFYNYWSEKTDKGKMKFQIQMTWETDKRLVTWAANEQKFEKPKNGVHAQETGTFNRALKNKLN